MGTVHIIICNPIGNLKTKREKKKASCTRIKFIADEQDGLGGQWGILM